MQKRTKGKKDSQDEQKIDITKKFLYKLRRIQLCCPVCPQCRKTIIDESLELANLYAELNK